MPSSPRKRAKAKRESSKHVDDNDSDDSYAEMPPLVHSDSDDEFRDDWPRRLRASNNRESVEMFLDLSKPTREKHIRVMKIYLLSPFLFDIVEQDDKWINWAQECKLLSTKRNCEPAVQVEECIESVDIIEEAFNKTVTFMLAKEDSEELEKVVNMMDKINTLDKLESAIICAESFPTYLKIRERIKIAHIKRKSDSKRKVDTSLLLVFQQIYDHIKKLTQECEDLSKQFDEMCKHGEQQSADLKKKGNNHFMEGKYKAAISAYSKAIIMSPYNHILYGNRAQSYLRTGETVLALADGRRSVILNPEWVKGQYRYAQAFFDLGDIERAISANREAKQLCQKNSKDLDSQHEKFLKEKDAKAKKISKAIKKETQLKMPNELDDLPDLVEPEPGDTSGDSDNDDDDIDDDDDDIDTSENSDKESVPELLSDFCQDSDSDDYEQKSPIEEELKSQHVQKNQINHTTAGSKELKKKKRKDQKVKQDQGKRKETENGISEASQKRRDLNATLKQGSKAYLDGKWMASLNFYQQVMQMFSVDDPFQVFKIKRIDYILILYTHGTACLETRIHKELQEASKKFETIIIQYKEVKFPLAYYGLGRVFHLQNRFSEALEPLNKGLDMVKAGDFGEYRWPGTQSIIEETKPGKLEVAFETIIGICQHPPKPDAICRFTDCQGRNAIYLNDPDYKGYVRLICDESCRIEYHPTCWKKYRSNYTDKNGEKDFLEEECVTPDCGAPLVQIQIFGSKGLKTEFVSEAKQKQTKQGKVKTHSKFKPDKKRREDIIKENKPEQHSDQEEDDPKETKKDEETIENKSKPTKQDDSHPIETPAEKPKAHVPPPEVKAIPDTRDKKDGDAGVYVLKKNEERLPDDLLAFKSAKTKCKKKKVKNVQSLDEFLKDHGGEVFKPPFGAEDDEEKPAEQTNIPPALWSEDELSAPFAVPSHLRSDIQAFERQYQSGFVSNPVRPSSNDKTTTEHLIDPIDDYIISLFTETLNAHGPMDVGDARIIEPVSFLPESHQQRIHDYGGIKEFLMRSEHFVVQGSVVMLPDELHFQEIVKNVNQLLNGGKKDLNNKDTITPQFTFPSFNDVPLNFPEHNDITPCPPIAPPLRVPSVGPFDELATHESPIGHLSSSSSETTITTSVPEIKPVDGLVQSETSTAPKVQPTFSNGQTAQTSLPKEKTMSANGQTTPIKVPTLPIKVEITASPAKKTTTDPKQIIFCDNENINKELQKFVEPLEKVGIPPTSKSIVNLITSLKLGESLGDSKLSAEQREPLIRNVGHLLDQIEIHNVSPQRLRKLSPETAKEAEKSSSKSTAVGTDDNALIDSKNVPNGESSPCLNTPPKHRRAGSSGCDAVITVKSKGIQTQLQVKAKGIMTDTMTEPYKMEYMKVSQEKEDLQRKLMDITDKLSIVQRKCDQELEKIKKKYHDVLSEKERLSKELQSTKELGKNEIKKMDKVCEEKDKRVSTLEHHFKLEQERYQSTIAGLKVELEAKTSELQNERAKLNSVIAQRDEALKKAVAATKKQESRAQDAEVKLLELRRDVGLKFLERSIHEASYTANNLINVRKVSTGSFTKLDELINSWRLFFHDCQQKGKNCTERFNAQIQEVSNGQELSSLPTLSIPSPSAYPGQPLLHMNPPMMAHIQSSFQLTPADMSIPSQIYPQSHVAQQPHPVVPTSVHHSAIGPIAQAVASAPALAPIHAAAPSSATAPMPVVPPAHVPTHMHAVPPPRQAAPVHAAAAPVAAHAAASMHGMVPVHAPPPRAVAPVHAAAVPNHAAAPPRMPSPHQVQVPSATPPVMAQAEGSTSAATKDDGKARPSNSFERIMLRLSTAYPYLARAELTSLIKEVRKKKNGSLTGLSLEEIVQSVDSLVDDKVKRGVIRIPPNQQPGGIVRSNSTPSTPQTATSAATGFTPTISAADSGSMSSLTFEADDDDPCVICHDDMRSPLDTVTLECGHKYHNKCIRKWLMGEQSTCPTCRVHALLPDEFPRLK